MSNRIMNNLPPIYDGIKEMEKLSSTVAVEIDALEAAKQRVDDEQFIMTASERAIRIRERAYNIRADSTTESLDFRRRRLIIRQSTRLPMTQRKVHEIVNELVGEGNWEERLNIEACEALFVFDASNHSVNQEIDYTLDRIIPLNIAFQIARRLTARLFVPTFIKSGSDITLYPININDIEQRTANRQLAAMKTAAKIVIRPIQGEE